jgi:hypothetical protein
MKQTQIIPLLIYVALVFTYLWFSTRFKEDWTRKCVYVKGGKINVLLFIFIFFIVLVAVVETTM